MNFKILTLSSQGQSRKKGVRLLQLSLQPNKCLFKKVYSKSNTTAMTRYSFEPGLLENS